MKIKSVFPSLPDQDKEVLDEMGNDLKHVLLRPFLILFKIPANLLEVMYHGVCLYSVKIPQCIGRLLMLPANLLISLCEGLSFGQVQTQLGKTNCRLRENIRNRTQSLGNRFSHKSSTGRKLKLYQKTVSRYCIADDSTARDYIREKCCYIFAFMLQAVSFFTTYAGLELYFGGVFFLAPFLITLVIQGTLYTAVVTVFQSRKRRMPMILCMTIFACASILFSYTGLITLYSPPSNDYAQAYETYAKRFEQAREALMEGYNDTEQTVTEIMKAADIMKTNVSMAGKQMEILTAQRDSIRIPPQFTSSRSISIGADGSQTTTTVPVANTGYQEALDQINQINAGIATLEQGCAFVTPFLEAYGEPDVRSLLENESPGSAGHSLPGNETSGEIAAASPDTAQSLSQLETDFSQAALANNSLVLELGNGATVDSELVTASKKSMNHFGELSSIILELPERTGDTGIKEDADGLMSLIVRAGRYIGADFGNADMNDLSRMRNDIRNTVNDNYSKMLAYGNKGIDLAPLSQAQSQVDALPGIMVFGAKRLFSPQSRSDALLCLCLSLFNDCTSILLGYAGTVNRGQDTLNRRGKHHINGINDLFITLYYSMHEAFAMQIKCGRFDGMDDNQFEALCRNFVNTASSHINRFIGKFTLSACTSSEGYNRCFIYKDEEEVRDFMPFISALMQAGLLDIMPLAAYLDIQEKYDRGIMWGGFKDQNTGRPDSLTPDNVRQTGYVLLLRNSGEEYMLKQLGYGFVADSVYEG